MCKFVFLISLMKPYINLSKRTSRKLKQAQCSHTAMWRLPLYVFFRAAFISWFQSISNTVLILVLFKLNRFYSRVIRSSATLIVISSAGKI